MSDQVTEFLFNMFSLFGGFGIFIYGMHIMADGLQKSAGNKMKNLLGILTNNRFVAVLVGAGVTAIIQSSSASTVMVVGFVNAGLMNLTQAVGVIMGANIGTTITSWLVSLDEILVFFKPDKIAPFVIGVGAVMFFFSRDNKKKQVGEIFVGFALIFIGLTYMKHGITPYKESPVFQQAFITLGQNPFLGVLAGALVTAVIQSSSASVGILQTLAATGVVPFSAAIYIVLGQNIGTTVTAMLSSIGANKTAKRAAVIHLLFNVIGTVVFTILAIVLFKTTLSHLAGTLISKVQISTFHTLFNVSCTVLMFGFANKLVVLAEKLVPGTDREAMSEDEITLKHLDDRILETPSFAVQNAIKEVVRMGELTIENTKAATMCLVSKDPAQIKKVLRGEKDINKLEKLITDYLVKINNIALNDRQHLVITNLFHTVNDIERVGDHAENIAELAQYYMDNDLQFSEEAEAEFKEISKLAIEIIELAIEARRNDRVELVKKVELLEERIDDMEEELRRQHIKRLAENKCNSTTGVVFLDTISNLERISDHALNIAGYVKEEVI
jgi:phosphate:Na+ symporter